MMANDAVSDSGNKTILSECLVSYIVKSPSQEYINNTIFASIINGLFLLLGCALNLLVIVSFYISKQLRSKASFFPLLVLCGVDFVTVLSVHPLFLTQAIFELREKPSCSYKVVYFSMLYIFPGMSATTLMLMNIERYVTIVRPFWHLQIARKKQKFLYACIFCWFLMAANLSCRLIKPFYSKTFTMVGTIIACFITLFTYGSIYWVARKRRKTPFTVTTSDENWNTRSKFLNELKIAKGYCLVIVLSFICFLPTGIVVFATRYPWRENLARRTLVAQLYTWTNTFVTISSTLNCLVFIWANTCLRKEVWKLWKNVCHTRRKNAQAIERN